MWSSTFANGWKGAAQIVMILHRRTGVVMRAPGNVINITHSHVHETACSDRQSTTRRGVTLIERTDSHRLTYQNRCRYCQTVVHYCISWKINSFPTGVSRYFLPGFGGQYIEPVFSQSMHSLTVLLCAEKSAFAFFIERPYFTEITPGTAETPMTLKKNLWVLLKQDFLRAGCPSCCPTKR